MTPTVGTAINLSGGVGDIVSQGAGGFVSLTGVLADNTLISTGRVPTYDRTADASTGTIGFATAGNTAGSYKFEAWYVPAEDGAYVIAA